MAKLYFYYGAMGSSKTANALIAAYNYEEKQQKALVVKTDADTRDGITKIRSRAGMEREAILLSSLMKKKEELGDEGFVHFLSDYHVVIVDEIQFAEVAEIDMLAGIVDEANIPVLCYGLRTNFMGDLFPASARLMAIADVILEYKTMCWCGRKATFNARMDENGEVVRSGELLVMGGNDRYTALCRKHYYKGITKKP